MNHTQHKRDLKAHGCQNCGLPNENHTTPDHRIETDHYTPLARGGPDTPDNLIALCGPCNRYKNAWTLEELNTRTFIEWRQKHPDRPPGTPVQWPTGFNWHNHTWDDGQPAKWIHGELFDYPIHPRDTWRYHVPLHDQPQFHPLPNHTGREG